ncbi:hypothetical protein B0H11DRAFT_855932 [Mycena galericulata]|nr:hypothetical protein B0H11DRAFT_855932 [Mycena galericulata]
MGCTRTLAILALFVLCSPVSAVVGPIGIGQVQLPTSTSTGTGSVLTTTTLIGACDGALACPTAPSSPDVTVVILPAPSSALISTSSDSSVLPSPSNSSSYLLSSSSTLFSTPMPSISIAPTSQDAAGTVAAVKDEAASHRRVEAESRAGSASSRSSLSPAPCSDSDAANSRGTGATRSSSSTPRRSLSRRSSRETP